MEPPAQRGPARRAVIGVDVGTVAVRGVAHDPLNGRLLAAAERPLMVHVRGEARELDAEAAWAALEAVLSDLAGQLGARRSRRTIDSVALACTASTVLVTSRRLVPQGRAVMWSDHRATAEAAEIRATRHPSLGRTLGHVSPEWGLPKFLWLVGSARAERAGGPVVELLDWLNWKLSGRLVANTGIREWGWCAGDGGQIPADLAAAIGLDDQLDRLPVAVARTGDVIGPVQHEVLVHHPLLRGAQVVMGGMDSYLAALGQGVVLPDRLAMSFGSSSSFLAGSDTMDAAGGMYGPFEQILPGPQRYWHGGQSTAGLAVSWLVELLGADRVALEREAAAISPGSDGLIFRETLLDRRGPRPDAPLRGIFDGLQLIHGRGHLYRAVLEGIAMGARLAVDALTPADVVVGGGLSASRLFLEILAGVMQRPVGVLRQAQPTAFGAAFAADAAGAARNNPVVATIQPPDADYGPVYARYRRLHELAADLVVARPQRPAA